MLKSKHWILASTNFSKCQEINDILNHAGFDQKISLQSEYKLPETPETGLTFIENALLKARAVSAATQLPAVADDSGLLVEGLSGQPGLYSSRFAGEHASSQDNIQKLLQLLQNHPTLSRQAYFYCIIVLLPTPDYPCPIISIGRLEGEIILTPRGNHGFGYDPVFYLPDYQKTLAELEPVQKNQISHRKQAVIGLIEQLKNSRAF